MRRRSFLRGVVAAFAIGMAPVTLNRVGLDLARDSRPIASGLFRLYRNGELVFEGENCVVDNGVDFVAQLNTQVLSMRFQA